jgi:hypothetical protein
LVGKPGKHSPTLREALNKVVSSRSFETLPDGGASEFGTRAGTMMKVVSAYREAAWKRLLSENADLRAKVYERKMEIAKAAAAGRKNLQAVEAQARTRTVNDLLQSYGVGGPAPQ